MLKLVIPAFVAAALIAPTVFAEPLSDEEAKAVKAEVMRRITTKTKKVESEALGKVFAATFYEIDVWLAQGNQSSQKIPLQLAKVGNKFVGVAKPTTNQAVPWLKEILNPAFRLKTAADAKVLEGALDLVYPISTFGNKESPKEIRHEGNKWIFVRGTFFDDVSGYIVTTDDEGVVTAFDYSLRIKKKQ